MPKPATTTDVPAVGQLKSVSHQGSGVYDAEFVTEGDTARFVVGVNGRGTCNCRTFRGTQPHHGRPAVPGRPCGHIPAVQQHVRDKESEPTS